MTTAGEVVAILHEKNRPHPAWVNRGLYRLLYNPALDVTADPRRKSTPGTMTPGADGQTLDGFSLATIEETIALRRTEQYRPTPGRRTYIPQAPGKWRPLGIPSPRETIVQECVRLIREALYEPRCHDNRHGFRPGRRCPRALESLRRNWVGTKWLLKIDIAECFERVAHGRLWDILREKIAEDRVINLRRKLLSAGYLENWVYHRPHSGTPQGAVMSPIRTNGYVSKRDNTLETRRQAPSQGPYRQRNVAQIARRQARQDLRKQGEPAPSCRDHLQGQLHRLPQDIWRTPAAHYDDPADARVKFLRDADEVAGAVIGPQTLAQPIQEEIAIFLRHARH